MAKIDDALSILRALGLPRAQQNERSALTLLALANLGPRKPWAGRATAPAAHLGHDGLHAQKYNKDYAANSRETIRRQTIHQFEQARTR